MVVKGTLSRHQMVSLRSYVGWQVIYIFLSRLNISICWQQSMLLLLKERDSSARFFFLHGISYSRRQGNNLNLLLSKAPRWKEC